MSKQSDAKTAQCYRTEAAVCANCQHYRSKTEEIKRKYYGDIWIKESMKRCAIGGFAVQKSHVCNLHEWRK